MECHLGYGESRKWLSTHLVLGAPCLARKLSSPEACDVLEVQANDGTACSAISGRSEPDPHVMPDVLARLRSTMFCDSAGKPVCSSYRVCEIDQAGPSCHQNETPTETGWCYIDPQQNPDDDPSLVANCPATEQRLLHFVDPMNLTPAPGATVLLACH